MRILEINKFHYLKRGAEKHYLDVIALLKSQGHEVAVFSMDNPTNIFSPWKKYFVSYVGYGKGDALFSKIKGVFRMFYSIEAKGKIAKLLDDFQPDIVHLHNIYHQISPSILGEIKKRKIPIIMTIHDFNLVCPDHSYLCKGKKWNELGEDRYSYFIKHRCFKNSYIASILVVLKFKFEKHFGFYEKYVDKFIAPSQFVKNIFVGEGFAPEKIEVIGHFISKDPLTCLWPKDKKIYEERYAFYFGSVSGGKNADALIRIFQDVPKVRLYLAGELEKGFALPKNWKIKYLGFLSAAEIEKYIRGSLFVLAPSKLPETFGLNALEALANGKPVICSDAGAYSEIIKNNRTGYICRDEKEMKEKIQKLAGDDGLRILFSRNALEKAQDFNSQKYSEKFFSLVDKIGK